MSQSFKNEAALHDPFAELQPISSSAGPSSAAVQVSPPLKELSPGQQKYNLGAALAYGPAALDQHLWQRCILLSRR